MPFQFQVKCQGSFQFHESTSRTRTGPRTTTNTSESSCYTCIHKIKQFNITMPPIKVLVVPKVEDIPTKPINGNQL